MGVRNSIDQDRKLESPGGTWEGGKQSSLFGA